jgi:class 3 adenylate cyclase/putative methionine-R-sulfoxide reductase with GAF domain
MENLFGQAKRPNPGTTMQRRLHLACGLLFVSPAAFLVYLGFKYELFQNQTVAVLFLALLLAALAALGVLNGAWRRRLERKAAELSVLKDLSEICHVSVDPDEVLGITLERALWLTRSDLGSVLVLNRSAPGAFLVKATVGLGEYIKPGDRIDFNSSIAQYAVINKAPLLVEDIEKDRRFGRANLSHYGTKSFLCLPLKTSKEIVGVITLSSRSQRVYGQAEIDVLTPLLGNAAFTYENLRLMRENERHARALATAGKIGQILPASFRDAELVRAVLLELHGTLPFDRAALLLKEPADADRVRVKEIWSPSACPLRKDETFPCEASWMSQAFTQEAARVLARPEAFATEFDRRLFAGLESRRAFLLPLRMRGSGAGVLVLVGDFTDPAPADLALAQWAATGLALALDRNRQHADVLRRDQEMQTIRQVGSVLASSTFDIPKVLNFTLDMIREVMHVETGSLAFLREDRLEVAAGFNRAAAPPPGAPQALGQGMAGYVAARGEAVIVNEPEKSPHFLDGIAAESGFRTRTALGVPMISQGRVIGVIEVRNKLNGPFDAGDRDLLQAIAASVCIALENARLYEQTVSAAEHERHLRRIFQKFVPKEVVDKILHGPEGGKPVLEELKTVTLLNIDIRGFSDLARRMGSRRMVGMLNRFFAAMGEIVFSHHGIVDKYLGDGFLAIFGAPVSTGEDAENAIAAALEMQARFERERSESTPGVAMGISVHTGEVVAGNIGFDKKMDYTVVGDPVNTVFRLQGLSKAFPNSVIVSGRTLEALRQEIPAVEVEIPPEMVDSLGAIRVYRLRGAAEDPLPGDRTPAWVSAERRAPGPA